MKKTLSVFLISALSYFNAQITVFNETFESSVVPLLPTGWISQDLDGNGSGWVTDDGPATTDPMGFSGKICGGYESTPDNLLISPSISIPVGGSVALNFKIGTYTVGGILPFDNRYAVYVLPATDTFTTAAVPVLSELTIANDIAKAMLIDLSGFAGQNIKIYFRHFNSVDKGIILLDDILIAQNVLSTSEVDYFDKIIVSPNPVVDVLYLKTKSKIRSAVIYDLSGRKINSKLNDNKVDVRDLNSGTFIITIETDKEKITKKFIKK
nr:T9SS type A sorting domain-containing protein [uncultured Chryseobacterium sp.]